MKKTTKSLTTILFLLICSTTNIQNAHAQPSLKNNLTTILTSIEEKSDNDTLKKLVREAKAGYTSDSRNDESLYQKLLTIDSISIKTVSLDRTVTLSFATA